MNTYCSVRSSNSALALRDLLGFEGNEIDHRVPALVTEQTGSPGVVNVAADHPRPEDQLAAASVEQCHIHAARERELRACTTDDSRATNE